MTKEGELERKVPTPKPDYRLEQMDDELLLYHPGQTKTVYLNQTASLVWQLCDGQRCAGEIMQLLQDSFPESADQIAADVRRALAEFERHGAIEYA